MPRSNIPNRRGPWRSLNYLKGRLSNWPYQSPPGNTQQLIWGPLTVQMTSYVNRERALVRNAEVLMTQEGFATALLMNARGEPDAMRGQVLMSLQSFTQILEWMFEADPSRFVRALHHKKGFDE